MYTLTGADGTPHATTAAEALDALDAPAALETVAVQVYVARWVRFDTRTVDEAPEPDWVVPPFDEVHVDAYEEIGEPFVAPAVTFTSIHDTAPATVKPLEVEEMEGVDGTAYGVVLVPAELFGPHPSVL